MLYDLAQKPPDPGSVLESVFLVIAKRRQESDFFKTRSLVEAILAPHKEKNTLQEAFKDYSDAMFPYLSASRESQDDLAKKALRSWTDKKVFRVKPLWQAKSTPHQVRSRLKKGQETVKQMEEDRRKGKLRRI